jgi:capsular polysaccharide transport system ATP-binding protein
MMASAVADGTIVLHRVSKGYRTVSGRRVILENQSIALPAWRHIGVLGRNGAGKSTLLRLIGGVERPDSGRIVRGVRVSWPLGFSGGFHPEMTAVENLRFICRVYGVDHRWVFEYVSDFSELGEYLHMPVKTYSSGMRAKLAFGLSLAINFDCFLIDEITAVGDAWFRKKAEAAFAERRKTSGLIMVSHSPNTIRKFCDMGLVLRGGRLELYDDLSEAVKRYSEDG